MEADRPLFEGEEEEPLTPTFQEEDAPLPPRSFPSTDQQVALDQTLPQNNSVSSSDDEEEFRNSSLPQAQEFEMELQMMDNLRKEALLRQLNEELPLTSVAMETSPFPNLKVRRKKSKTPDSKRISRASLKPNSNSKR